MAKGNKRAKPNDKAEENRAAAPAEANSSGKLSEKECQRALKALHVELVRPQARVGAHDDALDGLVQARMPFLAGAATEPAINKSNDLRAPS